MQHEAAILMGLLSTWLELVGASKTSGSFPTICKLPQEKGICSAYHSRYYYNQESKECEKFIYGGCLGNQNRFETIEECRKRCKPARDVLPAVCKVPKKPGKCSVYHIRYYYDLKGKKCGKFIYTGCGGNGNNFRTLEECKSICRLTADTPDTTAPRKREIPAICRIPKDPGPCSEHDLRFFYDTENQDCKTFLYGGCGGNANHFRSREECMQICKVQTDMNAITTTPAPTEPPENVPHICKLPKSPGSCSEKQLRFYYDFEHEICKAFLYSGCGGNANLFPSIDECMDICKVLTSIKFKMVTTTTGPPTEDVPHICKLPKNPGSCSEKQLRFYYDFEHEICKAFLYSGCGGNANLFPSIDECMDICKVLTSIKFKMVKTTTRPPTEHLPDVCRVPKDHGPCSKTHLRFYYDLDNGKCKIFLYGGCGGSANHFRSMAQCKAICEKKRRLES